MLSKGKKRLRYIQCMARNTFHKFFCRHLIYKNLKNYENILEEKQIDISPIQDSIRSYKNLEETLKVIKSKINDLHEMEELYKQLLDVNSDKKYLNYLLKLFELESFLRASKKFYICLS